MGFLRRRCQFRKLTTFPRAARFAQKSRMQNAECSVSALMRALQVVYLRVCAGLFRCETPYDFENFRACGGLFVAFSLPNCSNRGWMGNPMVVVGWVEIMPRYLNVPEWVSSTVVVGCKVVCIDRHFLEYNLKNFAPNKHAPFG